MCGKKKHLWDHQVMLYFPSARTKIAQTMIFLKTTLRNRLGFSFLKKYLPVLSKEAILKLYLQTFFCHSYFFLPSQSLERILRQLTHKASKAKQNFHPYKQLYFITTVVSSPKPNLDPSNATIITIAC